MSTRPEAMAPLRLSLLETVQYHGSNGIHAGVDGGANVV
jgi:hypothetical protein